MAKQTYVQKLFIQTEVLTSVVHQRFICEGYEFRDAGNLSRGYMQSFLVNLLADRLGQKETLQEIECRIAHQQELITKLSA